MDEGTVPRWLVDWIDEEMEVDRSLGPDGDGKPLAADEAAGAVAERRDGLAQGYEEAARTRGREGSSEG